MGTRLSWVKKDMMLLSLAFIVVFTTTSILTCPSQNRFDDSYTLLVKEVTTRYRSWDDYFDGDLEYYMDDDWQESIERGTTTYDEQLEKADKRVKKIKETYNPIKNTYGTSYWKRNLTANRWQAGNSPDTAWGIEKRNEKGEIWHYTDWDLSGPKCKCRKSKKYSFSGVGGKGSWCSFDNSYRLINTKTEGSKTYMQFYQYSYCEELDHTFRTYWTTVYDKVTGSHLPYEKYFHYTDNYSGWDSYNITYIPTQFDWINLPDDC